MTLPSNLKILAKKNMAINIVMKFVERSKRVSVKDDGDKGTSISIGSHIRAYMSPPYVVEK